jgi:hypothetical protein
VEPVNKDEIELLIADLKASQEVLLLSLNGVTENLAVVKPRLGWSILECIEHVAIAEEYMFAQIASAKWSPTPVVNGQREDAIRVRGTDRTRKIEAPSAAKPAGRFTTLAAATQHFLATRQRTLTFLENCDADLRAMLTNHPLIGQVNCYEMLLIMAVHPQRHARQIDEIRADMSE